MDTPVITIRADLPIVALTGAVGSGCSYFADGIADFYGFSCLKASSVLRKLAKEMKLADSPEVLQDIGDQLRRDDGDYALIQELILRNSDMLASADTRGVVIDGIKNSGEVDFLRGLPNFWLVSVHAKRKAREDRLVGVKRGFETAENFRRIDRRDEDGRRPYGQQVKRCNDLADIIVINDEKVAKPEAKGPYKKHVTDKFGKHIERFDEIAKDQGASVEGPTRHEALMTVAYVESQRSRCLKRKVGAVLATSSGKVISAGHNDIPPGSDPCYRVGRLGWCARDMVIQRLGEALAKCPGCGKPIEVNATCIHCQVPLDRFYRVCPNCRKDPDIEYRCANCDVRVFEEYLPGSSDEKGKLLDVCRSLHAEENAILSACQQGAKIPENAVLYTTTFPCNLCANKIRQVGIREVVYAEPYTTAEAEHILRAGEKENEKTELTRFEGVKSTAFMRYFA